LEEHTNQSFRALCSLQLSRQEFDVRPNEQSAA